MIATSSISSSVVPTGTVATRSIILLAISGDMVISADSVDSFGAAMMGAFSGVAVGTTSAGSGALVKEVSAMEFVGTGVVLPVWLLRIPWGSGEMREPVGWEV